jgi:TonB family protein
LVNPTRPQLPREAELKSGQTKLVLCVEYTGQSSGAAVEASSGDSRLDKAALDWVQAARFEPSRWFGIPMRKCNYRLIVEWRPG